METLKRHPVIAYFILAYVLPWWMFPLLQVSPLLGLFGLFGPALAAIIMAAIIGGSSGVKALLKRVVRWPSSPLPLGPIGVAEAPESISYPAPRRRAETWRSRPEGPSEPVLPSANAANRFRC